VSNCAPNPPARELNVDAGRGSDAFVSNEPDFGEIVDIDAAGD